MPTYHYRCFDCGNEFDQFQKFADDPLTVCPACEGSIRRVIQPVGVVFKGSGWYITDSRSSGGSTNGKDAKSEKADAAGKTDTAEPKSASPEPAAAAKNEAKTSTEKSTSKAATPA